MTHISGEEEHARSFNELRHINSHCSATRDVPHDVLFIILVNAAPPPMDITSRDLRLREEETHPDDPVETYTPLRLRAVCSQWLYAASATPQLWTSLVLDVGCDDDVEPAVSILKTYLKNVGHLPLSLELNFNVGTWYPGIASTVFLPFDSVIFQESSRIKVLGLSGIPSKGYMYFPIKQFPRLEEVRWGCNYSHPPAYKGFGEDILSAPHLLRRIIMKNTVILLLPQRDVSQFPNLTTVNLFHVPDYNCLDILLFFPNLVEFRARDSPYPTSSSGRRVLKERPTFPKLEIFEWTLHFHGDTLASKMLLEDAEFHSLRILGMSGPLDPWGRPNFFRRLPQCLSELEIRDGCGFYLWRLWQPLSNLLVGVQKLSFIGCSLACPKSALWALQDKSVLPSLSEVCIIDRPSPRFYGDKHERLVASGIRVALQKMAENRFKLSGPSLQGGGGFIFSTVNYNLGWRENSRFKWVQDAAKRGVRIDILENGNLVNWCR